MDNGMLEMAERLYDLRERKAEAEQAIKDVNAEIEKTEYSLIQLMAQTETPSFKHKKGHFTLRTMFRASAVAGYKDELYQSLRDNGYGDLIYETVNANSLSSFVKECMEENEGIVPNWLTGLINPYEKTSIAVKKI